MGFRPVTLRMFGTKDHKARKRFYLLPGMGGRAYQRKQKFMLKSALVVGVLVSAIIAALLYWLNRMLK